MLQVGVDCEEISRFRKLPYEENKRFYRKIFTQPEIEYCASYKDPYPRFAVRFAAKEAAIKALSNMARLSYADIEIQKGKKEQPRIHINRNRFRGIRRLVLSLSLTHSNSYAIAFVVVSDNKNSVRQARQVLRKSISYVKKKTGR